MSSKQVGLKAVIKKYVTWRQWGSEKCQKVSRIIWIGLMHNVDHRYSTLSTHCLASKTRNPGWKNTPKKYSQMLLDDVIIPNVCVLKVTRTASLNWLSRTSRIKKMCHKLVYL